MAKMPPAYWVRLKAELRKIDAQPWPSLEERIRISHQMMKDIPPTADEIADAGGQR